MQKLRVLMTGDGSFPIRRSGRYTPAAPMKQAFTVFISMYATLLAIINPLEALPVFLSLLSGKDPATQQSVADVCGG